MDENMNTADVVEDVITDPATDTQDTPDSVDIEAVLLLPAVQERINKAITEGIQTALKGVTPKRNTQDPTATDKANFQKMGYKERLKIYQADPAKYNKLTGGN